MWWQCVVDDEWPDEAGPWDVTDDGNKTTATWHRRNHNPRNTATNPSRTSQLWLRLQYVKKPMKRLVTLELYWQLSSEWLWLIKRTYTRLNSVLFSCLHGVLKWKLIFSNADDNISLLMWGNDCRVIAQLAVCRFHGSNHCIHKLKDICVFSQTVRQSIILWWTSTNEDCLQHVNVWHHYYL